MSSQNNESRVRTLQEIYPDIPPTLNIEVYLKVYTLPQDLHERDPSRCFSHFWNALTRDAEVSTEGWSWTYSSNFVVNIPKQNIEGRIWPNGTTGKVYHFLCEIPTPRDFSELNRILFEFGKTQYDINCFDFDDLAAPYMVDPDPRIWWVDKWIPFDASSCILPPCVVVIHHSSSK